MGKKEEKNKKTIVDPLENNKSNHEIKAKKKEAKKSEEKQKKAKKVDKKEVIINDEKKKKTDDQKKSKKDALVIVSEFLGSIKSKHLSDVLFDLMTEKEIGEFAERIEILKQLTKGITQRVIAKNLGISVTTVSRGSKVIQTGKQKIKKYL